MYKKFRTIENQLAVDFFYPESTGSSTVGAALFLYGLPSFIGQNEVTYAAVKAGMVSVHPHYYGTYDSGGLFSPDSVVETCKTVQSMFSRGWVHPLAKKEAFQLPKLLSCVGHSFGCLAALRAAQSLPDLRKIVLLAPTVHYRKTNPDYGNTADGFAILNSIATSHRHTYRLSSADAWQEVMGGNEVFPPTSTHPSLVEVVAVMGTRDPYLKPDAIMQSLPGLVSVLCGERARTRFVTVTGAGHNIADLLGSPSFNLTDELQGAS